MKQQYKYQRRQVVWKSQTETSPSHFSLSNSSISAQVNSVGSSIDLELKNEIIRMRSVITSLESKVNSHSELIVHLQNELKQQLERSRENEAISIEKVNQALLTQIGIFERRMIDESQRTKMDISTTQAKIQEIRVEMEPKFISINDQIRIIMQSEVSRIKTCFENQLDSEQIHKRFYLLSQEIRNLQQNKLDAASPIIQKLNKLNETQIYQIDKNGYLMDDQKNYLFQDNGNLIRLKEQQISHLQSLFD